MVSGLNARGVAQRVLTGREASAASLARVLEDWQPDVLHFHAGPREVEPLLALAGPRSVGVVVTMRDYSWICERGTCVDARGVSCLPAVTPGSCACLSGTDSLARRNTALRAALRPSDLALIPPTLAGERLVASGVPARVRVLDPTTGDAPAQLHGVYREAIERGRESSRSGPAERPRHVVFIVGAAGSPLRYRVHQKVEQLALQGVTSELRWYSDPRLPAAVERADSAIVYRAPATRQLVEIIRSARRQGVATFWDVDDLIFDPDTVDQLPIHGRHSRRERDEWIDAAHRYRGILMECGAGIASTPEIARHMVRLGVPAAVHPNGVDTAHSAVFEGARRAAARDAGTSKRPFTIGYCSGTDTHDADFELVGMVLSDVLEAHPEVRMLLVGPLLLPRPLARFSDRIDSVGWVPGMEVPRHLARFDLNIAPLVTHDFTNGKSAIKWSEAALVGAPTLAWATEPFRMAIEDGRTGFLAADAAEFQEKLEHVLSNRSELPAVAEAARLAAFEQGSPWVLGANLTGILRSADRAPIRQAENRWPRESHLTDVEPPGLMPGLAPARRRKGPGERLDAARVAFRYPLDKGPLRRADVQIATWLQPAHSPLELRVRVGGRVLATATVAPSDMADNSWVTFNFDPPVPSVWGAVAELSSDRFQNLAPYVADTGSRYVNGVRVPGAVIARTFHEPLVPPDFNPRRPGPSRRLVEDLVRHWFSSHWPSLRRGAGRVARRLGVRVPSMLRQG